MNDKAGGAVCLHLCERWAVEDGRGGRRSAAEFWISAVAGPPEKPVGKRARGCCGRGCGRWGCRGVRGGWVRHVATPGRLGQSVAGGGGGAVSRPTAARSFRGTRSARRRPARVVGRPACGRWKRPRPRSRVERSWRWTAGWLRLRCSGFPSKRQCERFRPSKQRERGLDGDGVGVPSQGTREVGFCLFHNTFSRASLKFFNRGCRDD